MPKIEEVKLQALTLAVQATAAWKNNADSTVRIARIFERYLRESDAHLEVVMEIKTHA